ncbi:DUF4405 domain-containing protein [Breoghania sp.]|uniref:DUF4405 domain-containing protein n=1 Tax=Breoghania sp. TaxID=2065378 RepID=UPI0026063776|nr:DUF4405 domain-containing protein [Breoghania sp.]MDJ0932806.1 DUF4405 domain-containing protein [Breoghania sp.]
MNRTLLVRLVLDFIAVGLLVLALAYEWLGNTVHELLGSAMLILVVVHTVFNRRWYANLFRKGPKDLRRRLTISINLALVVTVLGLLVSSILVSRFVFAFMGVDGGFMARQIHTLTAYWILVLGGVHLGMHWTLVLNTVRGLLSIRLDGRVASLVLRRLTVVVALFGIESSIEMNLGAKLVLLFTFNYWDFDNQALQFLLRFGSIVGLYTACSHYIMRWVQMKNRRNRIPRS